MNSKPSTFFLFLSLFFIGLNAQTKKTEILILGTSHLEQIKGFRPEMINMVIRKLDSFNFEIIGIEKMSGELLNDIQSRKDSAFDGITNGGFGAEYLRLADTVQRVKEIPFLKAEKRINFLLNREVLNEADRKELVFNFIATTDIPSATLQYAYLKDKDDFASAFEKQIAKILREKVSSKNEYYSLALRLAQLENLEQLHSVDNFQDEPLLFKYYPEFVEEFQANSDKFSGISELPVFKRTDKLVQQGLKDADLSKLFDFLNSDEFGKQDYEAQWKIWLNTNFSSGSDLGRYYLWEMRNLQITSNILRLISRNPGKRILIIIGASHRSFLEKYLGQISGLKLLSYN